MKDNYHYPVSMVVAMVVSVRKEAYMKTGMYELPNHYNLKRMSLLWDNATDKNFEEAKTVLKTRHNEIQQIVIKTTPNDATYATEKLIQFFLNQHWERGVRYTHNEKGHMIAFKTKADQYRVFIENLFILVYYTKEDAKVYRLTPQMHIYPSTNEEMYSEDKQYPVWSASARYQNSILTANSDYAYYKFIQGILFKDKPKEYFKDPNQTDNSKLFEQMPLLRAFADAYEIDANDKACLEQIDYYIINQIPITRMPLDTAFYDFCSKLGLVPIAQELYDDTNFVYIGKEDYLDNYDD
jgi:hypothetical protein